MPAANTLLVVGMESLAAFPGGLNRYVHDLTSALAAAGRPARCLYVAHGSGEQGGGAFDAAPAGAPLPRRLLALRRAAALTGAGSRGTVLDLHFPLYGAAVLPGRVYSRVVVHFHGPWGAESLAEGARPLHSWMQRQVERYVFSRADVFVTLSDTFRDLLVEEYGVAPGVVRVHRPGVDLTRFAPPELPGRPVAGPVTVLAVRRLARRMGLDVLLQAFARCSPDALLQIAGEGEERAALEELARQVGVADRVQFLGRVSEEHLAALYAGASFTVVPSLSLEGFGLVVLESLACGTPVLASATGGMAEVLPQLEDGLLVPPGDVEALARRMQRAIEEPASLPTAERCRAFAETFTWDATAQQALELFDGDLPLRVVFLVHSAQPAGGELALLRLLTGLTGVDPYVILAEPGPLEELLVEQGVAYEVLSLGSATRASRGDLRSADALAAVRHAALLARRLRQLRPHLVHTNSLKSGLYGGVAARLAGIPVVWHLRDLVDVEHYPQPLVRLVRGAARVLPRVVVANSAATLRSLHLPARTPGHVLPSPVLLPARQVERPPRPLVVGVLGRLAPWKGQHIALAAFARAFPDGPERLRCIGAPLFGEDAYADELRSLCRDLGVEERVEFRGHRRDVAAELEEVDVLVHSAVLPEPYGNVVVEGMAAGLPVIAADAGGPRETVTSGVDGLLTAPGDVEELAAALRTLAGDPELRRRLGAAGVERAAAYAPAPVASRLRRIYDDMLGAGNGSA